MVTTSNCRHHWLIETPSGATSPGYCKRCGEERQFSNYFNTEVRAWVSAAEMVLRREEAKVRQTIRQLSPFS